MAKKQTKKKAKPTGPMVPCSACKNDVSYNEFYCTGCGIVICNKCDRRCIEHSGFGKHPSWVHTTECEECLIQEADEEIDERYGY